MAIVTTATPRQQSILDSFDYHRPSLEQSARIETVRAAFKRCALTVIQVTPEGADQTAALRQLHEAMMTANKAIACEPGTPHEVPLDLTPVCQFCSRPGGRHYHGCRLAAGQPDATPSPMDGDDASAVGGDRDPNPGV
jgi:hypothetical protein